MTEKKLYLKFVESGVTGILDVHWDVAPETCAAIWEALSTPIRVPASHAMYAGPEIMCGLPEANRTFDPLSLPPENQSVYGQPGDMLWFYQPKNFFRVDPSEFWEIGMFYSEGGRVFGPTGWIPVTFFARMTEGLDAIAEQCGLIRKEGVKTIEIGRHG